MYSTVGILPLLPACALEIGCRFVLMSRRRQCMFVEVCACSVTVAISVVQQKTISHVTHPFTDIQLDIS